MPVSGIGCEGGVDLERGPTRKRCFGGRGPGFSAAAFFGGRTGSVELQLGLVLCCGRRDAARRCRASALPPRAPLADAFGGPAHRSGPQGSASDTRQDGKNSIALLSNANVTYQRRSAQKELEIRARYVSGPQGSAGGTRQRRPGAGERGGGIPRNGCVSSMPVELSRRRPAKYT